MDGHDLPELIELFKNVQQMHGPILIHVKTEKGRGLSLIHISICHRGTACPALLYEKGGIAIGRQYTGTDGSGCAV